MLFRASVLSILILVTVAASLPFGESLAAYGRRAAAARSGKRQYRRGSRAWRQRRRAYLRRQRAIAAARRRRQRAWVLRRRAASRNTTVARARARRPQTLRALLAPMRLPTASPSAVESIQSIEMEIAAAPQLAAPQVVAPQIAAVQFATPQPVAQQAAAPQAASPQLPTRQTPLAQITSAGSLAHAAAPRDKAVLPAVTVVAAQPAAAAPITLASPAAVSVAPLAAATPFNARPTLAAAPAATAVARPAQRITGLPVPRSWQAVSSTLGGEFKFSVRTSEGRAAGAAVWSRVALPAASIQDRRNKSLGGVSHTALRRTVIDRMIAEGGWVVNDFEREVNGRRVFVVFAQSEGERGARRNWTYYFTETDGLVYSLATTTTSEFTDSVAADAEQTLSAIFSRAPQK